MKRELNFDIFLSYSRTDRVWVKELKEELEKLELNVWYDQEQIPPGALFISALELGLEQSSGIVIVVSQNSGNSNWVREEYHRALQLSNKGDKKFVVIPVIYQLAEIPGFLQSRNWVSLEDEGTIKQVASKIFWGISGNKHSSVEIDSIVMRSLNKKSTELLLQIDLHNDVTRKDIDYYLFGRYPELTDKQLEDIVHILISKELVDIAYGIYNITRLGKKLVKKI